MPLHDSETRPKPRITPREQQVIILIVRAVPIKEIAAELGLSRNTVAQYLAKLYAKVGVHSARELALWAMREQILQIEDLNAPAA